MKENTFDELVTLMIYQAKAFLEETREFFPYASVLTTRNTLETVGIMNSDDENFDAIKAIVIFKSKIAEQIKSGEIFIGAIGIGVTISETNQNALMIKASDNGVRWHERSYPYYFSEGKVIFNDNIS
ncbi:hypothetical protein [Flavobacterium cerinum]|uniref:Uncharacterized protein n=1 Tax=Flavobacterium cerinum TaxID=2502784 RepID=A0ABY5IS17_9FLAO|nr:hypothetical protein [Flavobacterium cerinum]UUC44164.1 hypothetical protein NOX80_11020 [Flavobacterium cerinum]